MSRILSAVSGGSLAIGGAWMLIVSLSGAKVTVLGSWYRNLDKPPWQPPDAAFGPVWTLIFGLAASALVIAWNAPAAGGGDRAFILGAYLLNGALNVYWSWLFFRRRRPDLALVETLALAASIILMMVAVGPHARPAVWLLAPYLAWVSFAFVLNLAVVRRNGPFAT